MDDNGIHKSAFKFTVREQENKDFQGNRILISGVKTSAKLGYKD
jgi:hypothetical protein